MLHICLLKYAHITRNISGIDSCICGVCAQLRAYLVAEYGPEPGALPPVRLVRTAALDDGSILHATRSWYDRAWYDAVRIDQQQGGEGSETLTLYARVVAIYKYGAGSQHEMEGIPLVLCEWLEAHDPIVERAGRRSRVQVLAYCAEYGRADRSLAACARHATCTCTPPSRSTRT